MNIFRKFKATFNLKHPNKTTKDKDECEIQCLKYKIHSEFTTEHVFDSNPRHFQETPFTPTQSRKLQNKSLSENNLSFQAFSTETEKKPEQKENKVENILWPSETNRIKTTDLDRNTKIQHPVIVNTEATNQIEIRQDEIQAVTKSKKEKGILKNKNEAVKIEDSYSQQSDKDNENDFSRTNFVYERDDITYKHYGTIDDQLEEEAVYYFEQKGNENPEEYVVHKSPAVHFAESENEYEEPIHESQSWDENIINPTYNLSTHPKLNPSFQNINDEEYAKSIGLNTFGNTQKLKYPSDYSLEAASIFFDNENDYDC